MKTRWVIPPNFRSGAAPGEPPARFREAIDMMQKKAISILGASAPLFLAAAFAAAQPAGGPPAKGPGPHMMAGMTRALGLSDTQKAAFQKLLEAQRPQMQALHQQMRDNWTKLQDLLKGESPDPAAVGELAIQEHKLMQQGRTLHEQLKSSLRALLTPEQQSKLDAIEALRGPGGFGGGPLAGFGRGMGGPRGWHKAPASQAPVEQP